MFYKSLLYVKQSRSFPDTVYAIVIQEKNKKFFPFFYPEKRIVVKEIKEKLNYTIGIVPRTLTDYKIPVYIFLEKNYPPFLGLETEYIGSLRFVFEEFQIFSLIEKNIDIEDLKDNISESISCKNLEFFNLDDTRKKLINFNKIFIKEFLL